LGAQRLANSAREACGFIITVSRIVRIVPLIQLDRSRDYSYSAAIKLALSATSQRNMPILFGTDTPMTRMINALSCFAADFRLILVSIATA